MQRSSIIYDIEQEPKAFSAGLSSLLSRLTQSKYVKTPQAIELEGCGVVTWLKTLAPNIFRSAFSKEQEQYWRLYWWMMHRKARGLPIPNAYYNLLMFFARGYGKSTNGEMSCVMEGAIVGYGYDLYLCDTKDLAIGHLSAIVEICQNGQIEQFYPDLAKPRLTATGKGEYSQTQIVTERWAVVAKGLRQNVRGKRMGGFRYTLVVADEVDALNDSLPVTLKKERTIARSVIPAGDKEMLFVFAQNLIHENAMATRIWEKKTDILSEHTIIGGEPVKAFKQLEITTTIDEKTKQSIHTIDDGKFITNWEHFNLKEAKRYLARAGKEAFLAEYQHEFKTKKGRLVPELSRERHIITWDQFEKVFGKRYIPRDWQVQSGTDFGYTELSRSAWAFNAKSAMNTALPGKAFTFRGFVFTEKSPDFQFTQVWKSFFPNREIGKDHFEMEMNFGLFPNLYRMLYLDPNTRPYVKDYKYNKNKLLFEHPKHKLNQFYETQIMRMQISHEKSGEMMTGQEKYGLPLEKMENFGQQDGVSQWNNLLTGNMLVPHPFLEDELVDESIGLYRLGCPDLFYVMHPEEIETNTGLMEFFNNAENWKRAPQTITELGVTEERAMKYESDTCDAERAIYSTFGAEVTQLTIKEETDKHIEEEHNRLTDYNIENMPIDQKGFAVAERQEIEQEFQKNRATVVRPKDLEYLDF